MGIRRRGYGRGCGWANFFCVFGDRRGGGGCLIGRKRGRTWDSLFAGYAVSAIWRERTLCGWDEGLAMDLGWWAIVWWVVVW
jgi:hypothetical protein